MSWKKVEGRSAQPKRVTSSYIEAEATHVRRQRQAADNRSYGNTGSKPTHRPTLICPEGHAYFGPGTCTRC